MALRSKIYDVRETGLDLTAVEDAASTKDKETRKFERPPTSAVK